MQLMLLEMPPMLAETANCNELILAVPAAAIAAVFELMATEFTTCCYEFALILIMFAATLVLRLPRSVDYTCRLLRLS